MTGAEIELAEAFLREAVYRSRARQGLEGAVASGDPEAPGFCGLGEKPAVVLDLDARGAALLERLWGPAVGDAELARIRDAMSAWIRRQDALDRKRNHFMRDFRTTHGSERERYAEPERRAWDAGLAEINEQVNRELRAAAEGLLAARHAS
jgi:hypothetical protein